jgi:YHS domain-containing protein
MQVSTSLRCDRFPCSDVRHDCFIVPDINVQPGKISIVLIAESAPAKRDDYYFASGNPLFQQTTVQAFRDAGADVASARDILRLGVYLTTAIKCAKTSYGVASGTVKECSLLLEQELGLFPNVKALLLMGDVAIKAVNYIAARRSQPRVIPAGSTYKIRGQEYYFCGKQVFPSYLQAGPSFFIEKSKRKMIAQDIARALALVR